MCPKWVTKEVLLICRADTPFEKHVSRTTTAVGRKMVSLVLTLETTVHIGHFC